MTDYRHVLRTAAAWFVVVASVAFVWTLFSTPPAIPGHTAETEDAPMAVPAQTTASDTSADDSEDHAPWYRTNHVPRPRNGFPGDEPPRDEPPQPRGKSDPAPTGGSGSEGSDSMTNVLVPRPTREITPLEQLSLEMQVRRLLEQDLRERKDDHDLVRLLSREDEKRRPRKAEIIIGTPLVNDEEAFHLLSAEDDMSALVRLSRKIDELKRFAYEEGLRTVKAERDALRPLQELVGGPALGWGYEHSETIRQLRWEMERARIEMRRPW